MSQFVHIESISSLYDFLNSGSSKHPQLAVIREWPKTELDIRQIVFTSDLYYIAMKGNKEGAFRYGRGEYDYQQGTMIFMAPGQAVTFSGEAVTENGRGWTLLFHPDLMSCFLPHLNLRQYSFFEYEQSESLHVSDKEREFINIVVAQIEEELEQSIDRHTGNIIVHHIESILKYCTRYYERQFYSRKTVNKSYITKLENYFKKRFTSVELSKTGVPTVEECGRALNMSDSYLSDLLRAETGKSAKEHIYIHLIELAKSQLLGTDLKINEIAYHLGFEYPQHFSKLFKSKTGFSPVEFRKIN